MLTPVTSSPWDGSLNCQVWKVRGRTLILMTRSCSTLEDWTPRHSAWSRPRMTGNHQDSGGGGGQGSRVWGISVTMSLVSKSQCSDLVAACPSLPFPTASSWTRWWGESMTPSWCATRTRTFTEYRILPRWGKLIFIPLFWHRCFTRSLR